MNYPIVADVSPQYHGKTTKPRIEFVAGWGWSAYIPRLERRYFYVGWFEALACVKFFGRLVRD